MNINTTIESIYVGTGEHITGSCASMDKVRLYLKHELPVNNEFVTPSFQDFYVGPEQGLEFVRKHYPGLTTVLFDTRRPHLGNHKVDNPPKGAG